MENVASSATPDTSMTTEAALADLGARGTSLLRRYLAAGPAARVMLAREIAEVLVECRSRFDRPDGLGPDWGGRTHPYRMFVAGVFADADVSPTQRATLQAAVRYHVSNVLRARVDAATLAEYGLQAQGARERSAGRRHRRAELLAAATGAGAPHGAVHTIAVAADLLARVDADALARLDDPEARQALEDLDALTDALIRVRRQVVARMTGTGRS